MIHGELVIGNTYYTTDGGHKVISFIPSGKSEHTKDVWYDGGLARNIKDIYSTRLEAAAPGMLRALEIMKAAVDMIVETPRNESYLSNERYEAWKSFRDSNTYKTIEAAIKSAK